uniref:SOCS box domain-containing protein n=1 Tax=Romanomermis culicivorax TaxID=13658 RepID=A0A915HTI5_ROMCU
MTDSSPGDRTYDYCLKFLLVGDSDVGKNEILNLLDEEIEVGALTSTISPKTTVILLEGKRVKLQLWDTSGQGRFGTIIRSYSRGAQGILVVYDITNHWSFEGINRWLKEIDEHAPGIPKILLGNRLHLEFRRRVSRDDAEHFAKKRKMEYFEVSTLALFTICESFTELSRLVLTRNGMERLWKHNKVLSLQELCYRCVAPRLITVHNIDRLPLPAKIKFELKSFAKRDQFTISNTIRRNRPSLMANNISPTQSDYICVYV